MLQRSASWVERVREIVVEEAADGGHVEIGKTAQSAGKVGWIVARTEDAAKLGVKQVFGDSPVKK